MNFTYAAPRGDVNCDGQVNGGDMPSGQRTMAPGITMGNSVTQPSSVSQAIDRRSHGRAVEVGHDWTRADAGPSDLACDLQGSPLDDIFAIGLVGQKSQS